MPADIAETGFQKQHVATIGRGNPTHQWNQQDSVTSLGQPQPQAVFFVADKPTAQTGLNRARSHRGVFGRQTHFVFLKELAAAGRSVASMIANALRLGSNCFNKGRSKCALTWRSRCKSKRSRNRCNIFASGISRWLGKRANCRHARFSGRSCTSKLKERAGVSRLSSRTRNNCAELHLGRRPGPESRGNNWLMK